MKKHHGISFSSLVSSLLLITFAGSVILLGMLIYFRFDAKRWNVFSQAGNADDQIRTNSLPFNATNQVRSPQQSQKPVPPKSIKTSEPSWAPTGNIPYHFRYNENSIDLVLVGQFYDVKVFLDREAALGFLNMQSAARRDGIHLQAVSGYRSFKDQEKLFDHQVSKRGSRLEASRISAPAGYSEHHTGYTLDIGDAMNQDEILTLSFEKGKAFEWLQKNASTYGFELSFPKNNRLNVSYEPWHWRFVGSEAAQETFRSARTMPHSEQRASATIPDQRP
jgi:LAS superfamily LD-carboxypeptidase LdcB